MPDHFTKDLEKRRQDGRRFVAPVRHRHLDVLTAEDDADNPVPAALVAFLARNSP